MQVWVDNKTQDSFKNDELLRKTKELRSGVVLLEGPSMCGKTVFLKHLKEQSGRTVEIFSYEKFVQTVLLSDDPLKKIDGIGAEIMGIEDADFLCGKQTIQESLAQIINRLSDNKLVIITGISLLKKVKTMVDTIDKKEIYSYAGEGVKGCFCDLHVHSTGSDGTILPQKLIQMAEKLNLSAVALCDHNTVDGLERFTKSAAHSKVQAVPGIEITAGYNGKEVHIVGLFVREEFVEQLRAFVAPIGGFKEKSNLDLITRLRDAGIDLDYDEIKNKADGFINRVNFAKAMIKKGYVSSVEEAFDKYLDDKLGYYVPAKKVDALDVISFLVSIKCVPVVAHPLASLSLEDLHSFLPLAKEKGLAAIELADSLGLLRSGGSDFHGDNKKDIYMGTGKGNLAVPVEYYEKLKERAL